MAVHKPANGDDDGVATSETLLSFFPEFPERLKRRMTEKGITTSQLRDSTGLSRPTLTRVSAGRANPVLGNLVKIAHCLGVPLRQLLGPQREPDGGLPGTEIPSSSSLLADPPRGDARARSIYEAICRGASRDEIRQEVTRLKFPLPGETPDEAIDRAILDVFHHGSAWIDILRLRTDKDLEDSIARRYNLPPRHELSNTKPVRVIDVDPGLHPLVQIHAVAVVAADIIKELLAGAGYRTLGFSDGFMVSTVQHFLRRGDLNKVELIPLVHTPGFVQFELSGATLVGAMERTHFGYRVRSTIGLENLKERISRVEVAVLSCGSAEREPQSRLYRLIRSLVRESSFESDYEEFLRRLEKNEVVGDLLYHFLKRNGEEFKVRGWRKNLENGVNGDSEPVVYSPSLDFLTGVAERGVSVLLVHSENRAPLVKAVLKSRKHLVNLIITTKAVAQRL